MHLEKIVACGMSGRFPECESVEELWNNLISKKDMMSNDKRRWDQGKKQSNCSL